MTGVVRVVCGVLGLVGAALLGWLTWVNVLLYPYHNLPWYSQAQFHPTAWWSSSGVCVVEVWQTLLFPGDPTATRQAAEAPPSPLWFPQEWSYYRWERPSGAGDRCYPSQVSTDRVSQARIDLDAWAWVWQRPWGWEVLMLAFIVVHLLGAGFIGWLGYRWRRRPKYQVGVLVPVLPEPETRP